MVTFCWVAIDPNRHVERWMNESWIQRLKMHNESARFGLSLMSEDEATRAKDLKDHRRGMPTIIDRAEKVDAYWSPRIAGFREPTHMLAFRGALHDGLPLGEPDDPRTGRDGRPLSRPRAASLRRAS